MSRAAGGIPAPPARAPRAARREPPSLARSLAFRVLERVEREGAYADLALRGSLERAQLAPRDRALATQLVYGVLRWRGRLDYALAGVLDRELAALEPRVVEVLRLGAYQLLFCDRVPDSAAVSESVRLSHAIGLDRASGLINAVLRRLARERNARPPPALADDPRGHLVHALSVPAWIAERWIAALGPAEAAALAEALNRPGPRTVRSHRQRVSRDALLAELRARGTDVEPCRFAPDGLRLGAPGDPTADPVFQAGLVTVQDEASQLVVELLDPQPGERVLDACAAPGTKATAIAERVGSGGRVIALDRHERRLGLIERDARRLGLDALRVYAADAAGPLPDAVATGGFDRVLVDAPCSGIGAWRRNPDARWRLAPQALPRLAVLQLAILRNVRGLLAPGGVLVYSTCTLTHEENEDVIDALLAEAPELRRTSTAALPARLRPLLDATGALRTLPHRHDTDGFFAVRLERSR